MIGSSGKSKQVCIVNRPVISRHLNQSATPEFRRDDHVTAVGLLATSQPSASVMQGPMGKMDVAILEML